MGGFVVAWLMGIGMPMAPPVETALQRFQFERVEMAVPVRIVLYCRDAPAATAGAEAAFDRIRQLNGIFSDYDSASELRRLSDTAIEGNAVAVSDDLWRVLEQAQRFAQQSDGAFDVTVSPLVHLWRRARRKAEMPSPALLESARELVGYRLLRLEAEGHKVMLLKPGMKLDLGAIAKGYAVDEALATLEKSGIRRALVDAGGDMVLGDPPPDQPGWRIGIARLDADGPPSRVLSLSRVGIATSGDTWQFVEIEGKRYSHLVDPSTGLGLTDHSNVTIIAPDGITADALASAVSVLGPEKGLKLIDEIPRTAALIVRAPEGEVKMFQSRHWADYPTVSGD